MRKYLLTYFQKMILEAENLNYDYSLDEKVDPEDKAEKAAIKKSPDKIKKELASDLGLTQNMPKDMMLKKLAKELYKAQYQVGTFKYVLADKVKRMKESGAEEDDIAKAEEMGGDQMTNTQMRVDAISAQMAAIAGDNGKLANRAEELSQEATNLALKAVQQFYSHRADDMEKQANKKIKEKEAEKEDSEKEKSSDEKKEK